MKGFCLAAAAVLTVAVPQLLLLWLVLALLGFAVVSWKKL